MKSIDFPGASLKIGGNQTDVYNVIHAYPIDGAQGEVIAIFELSDEEAATIAGSKKIYYSRLTFGSECKCKHCGNVTPTGFQPMRLSTDPIEINVEMIDAETETAKVVSASITSDGLKVDGFVKNEDGKYTPVE